MKKILFIRHADSSWAKVASRDIEKPLSIKGKNEAKEIGIKLNNLKIYPQLFYCSSSTRTMETYNGIIHELDVKGQIEYNDDLYSDTSNAASQLIRKTTNNIDFISVIAHNPYIHSLYNNVCKSNPIKFKSILRYPTCGAMLCTNAAQKWADIDLISSSLREFHFPVYIKPKLY